MTRLRETRRGGVGRTQPFSIFLLRLLVHPSIRPSIRPSILSPVNWPMKESEAPETTIVVNSKHLRRPISDLILIPIPSALFSFAGL